MNPSPNHQPKEVRQETSPGLLQTGSWKVKTKGLFQFFAEEVFRRKKDTIVQTTEHPQSFLSKGAMLGKIFILYNGVTAGDPGSMFPHPH